jgi:two-component system chemotaxis response regulator CheY
MLNVLVVDDSVTIRRVIKSVLSNFISEKLRYYEASNGKEAYDTLRRNRGISLVLLDVHMPEMNGDEFLKMIREEACYNNVRVVMITTVAEKQKVMELMKIGVNGYVVKPFTPETLRNAIEPIFQRIGISMNPENA